MQRTIQLKKADKFPGLNSEQKSRIEELTAGLTGVEKSQKQSELYKGAISLKKKQEYEDNRTAVKNEMWANSLDTNNPNDSLRTDKQLRQENLADLVKEFRNLDYRTPTNEVLDAVTKEAQIKGVSADGLYNYLDHGDEKFLYDMGYKKQTAGQWLAQAGTNIVGGAYDSATSLARMGAKGTASAIGWAAKKLGADENKVNELVNDYKNYLDDEMSAKAIGADTDSWGYNVTKGVGDLAQVMVGEGAIKGAVGATAKGAELANYLKTAPTWAKMVAGGLEGAGDMALYSIVAENKLPTTGEALVGAGLGAALPGAGAVLKATKNTFKKTAPKIAAKLELNGLLNPAKLETIKNQLVNEGTDLASAGLKGGTAEDVGKWMVDRGFKGEKEKIISDLGEYAKKSRSLKKEVLGASASTHEVDSARKSLKIISDTIDGVPGLEERAARVSELMNKESHTLSELDEIKSILDDTVSIYTQVGDVRAGAVKDGLDKVRKNLRKYIEDAATKEGLGNIKLLNNETQIAKGLEQAISKKDSADAVREALSVFSKSAIGGAAGYNVGPFDSNTLGGKVGNVIVGALAGRYLFSTKAKTQFASLINKMSGVPKKELERLVAGDLSVKKLSNVTKNKLADILEKSGIEKAGVPSELSEEEFGALLNKYSKSDLPALELKEGVNNYNTIIGNDSKKIIADAEGNALREGQIGEKATQNINYIKQQLKDAGVSDAKIEEIVNEIELSNAKQQSLFGENEIKGGKISDGLFPEKLEYGKVNLGETQQPMTQAIEDSIKGYVAGDEMRVNQYLRDPSQFGKLSKEEQAVIDNLSKATESSTVEGGKLYRAVDADAIFGKMSDYDFDKLSDAILYGEGDKKLANSVIDKEITEKGFMSTSKNKSIIDEWDGFTGQEHEITLELDVPKGTKGKDLSMYDIAGQEQEEVLLARNTKYKIKSVEQNPEGGILVKATIIK